MRLTQRYRKLSFWNKIGFWGSVASIIGIAIIFIQPVVRRLIPRHVPPDAGHASDLRGSYYVFEGSLLLQRALAGYGFDATNGFASKPQWLKNDVLEALTEILNENRETREDKLQFDQLFLEVTDEAGNVVTTRDVRDPDSADERTPEQQLFRGFATFRGPNWSEASVDALISQARSDPHWTVTQGSWRGAQQGAFVEADAVQFFGMPPARHLAKLVKDPITQRLAARYPDQRDLAIVSAWTTHGSYTVAVHVRELKLVVFGIENQGSKPVALTGVTSSDFEADRWTTLTSEADLARRFAEAPVRHHSLPLDSLLPGQHLFIPIAIELGIASTYVGRANPNYEETVEDRHFPPPVAKNKPLTIQLIRGLDDKSEFIYDTYTFQPGVLDRKVPFRQNFQATYYLGSAHQIRALVANEPTRRGVESPVRTFDRRNILARGWFESGSCPVLYAQFASHTRRVRPVLVEAVTATRESTDRIDLPPDTLAIELREEEAETSFVRDVRLTIHGCTGTTKWVELGAWPKPHELRRGEILRFPIDRGDNTCTSGYTLEVKGYYLPDKLVASRRRAG